MDELDKLKKAILEDYPHMTLTDTFQFECGPDLECFNCCCADVNIFLMPYDVLRMRRAIGMGSSEFLRRYTLVPFDKNLKLPVPLLQLDDSAEKKCQFVDDEQGCTIYDNRPSPCRMYPVGMGSPGEGAGGDQKPFYFLMREDVCKGFERSRWWTVQEWLKNQGFEPYIEFNELFKQITTNPLLTREGFELKAQQVDGYWTALYDLDKFRRFIFESSFLDKFVLEDELVQRLKSDDEALLRFGFRWVKMILFGEKALQVKPEVQEKFEKR